MKKLTYQNIIYRTDIGNTAIFSVFFCCLIRFKSVGAFIVCILNCQQNLVIRVQHLACLTDELEQNFIKIYFTSISYNFS